MNAPTDWASALAILAAGLILGALVFFVSRRRKASAASKRGELEARRDALVEQLRDLGDDAGDKERSWLESETADVLRALDGLPATPKGQAPPPPRRRNPATSGFVWGVTCTLIAGGIVYYGSTFVTERGTTQQPQAAAAAQGAPELQQLEAAVRNEPDNIDARIALAKAYFSANNLMATFEQTNAVLEKNPNEARALTYNAIVRMAMGEVDQARAMLEKATESDPKLLDAWVALSSAHTQLGNPKGASFAINTAIAQYPQDEQRLREVFAEIQKQAPAASAATAASNLPPDHPPMPGMELTPPQAAVADSQPIHITLSLDPSSNVTSGVVYVIARGTEAGHPVAVRRVQASAFPLSLEFGANDAMMGKALPQTMRLEARLDTDGDAGTNDPSDPRAAADGVSAGANVALKLARVN